MCAHDSMGSRRRCTATPPSASAGHRFRFSDAAAWWDAGGMYEAGSSGRPRCWDNVHGLLVLIATVLLHISITRCWAILGTLVDGANCSSALSLCLSPLPCIEAYTEVTGWQLYSRCSQWRPAFFCKMQPRSCRWRPWYVRHTYHYVAAILQ